MKIFKYCILGFMLIALGFAIGIMSKTNVREHVNPVTGSKTFIITNDYIDDVSIKIKGIDLGF